MTQQKTLKQIKEEFEKQFTRNGYKLIEKDIDVPYEAKEISDWWLSRLDEVMREIIPKEQPKVFVNDPTLTDPYCETTEYDAGFNSAIAQMKENYKKFKDNEKI